MAEQADTVYEKEIEVDGKKTKKTVISHGDVLVVKDPIDVIIRSARVHGDSGHVAYPGNVPADVWPVSIMIDAGAGITKVVLKHCCVKRADSVRSLTLLGVLIGTKDTYAAMSKAFGPLYAAVSEVNRRNVYVTLPWAPQLPVSATFELSGHVKLPTLVQQDVDMYLV